MWWILALVTALAADPNEGPAMNVSGGLALFAPLNRPLAMNPGVDGQFDLSEILPELPWLGASASAQTGVFFYRNCSDCMAVGKWSLGVGPGVFTHFVDANLFLRVAGFGRRVSVRPALQVTAKLHPFGSPLTGTLVRRLRQPPIQLRPFLAVEGTRFPDVQYGLRVGARLPARRPATPPPAESPVAATSSTTETPEAMPFNYAACPALLLVAATVATQGQGDLGEEEELASLSPEEVAERRQALLTELMELYAIESAEEQMAAFRESLLEIEGVLRENARDVDAAKDQIEAVQEAVDDFADVLTSAQELLDSNAGSGALDAATGTSSAYDAILSGIGAFGDRSTESADALKKLSSALAKVHQLQQMDGAQSDELIREFSGMLGTLTDILGPLIDLVPGVGAFLQLYEQALDNIAGSIGIQIGVMKEQNRVLQELGMQEFWGFTKGASDKRRCRIDAIEAELGELDLYAPETPASEPQLTEEERRDLLDADIAWKKGLEQSGIGEGSSSPEAGFSKASRRLAIARRRLQRSFGDVLVNWFDNLPKARERLATLTPGDKDWPIVAGDVALYEQQHEDFQEAYREYQAARKVIVDLLDTMQGILPPSGDAGTDYFDGARELLAERSHATTSFETDQEDGLSIIRAFCEDQWGGWSPDNDVSIPRR